MELSHLRYFCCVAETASFVRGARLAHISAPAMTKAVRKLEEELGARLFERSTRRVTLTEAGGALLLRARGILAEVEGIGRDLDDLRSEIAGELRIAAMEVFSIRALPRALAALVAKHPALVPLSYEMHPEEMIRGVEDGSLDVGFSIGPVGARPGSRRADARRGIVSELIGTSPACVVCGAGHPLYAEGRVKPSELARHPFVAPRFFQREHLSSLDQFPEDRYARTVGASIELLQMGLELALSGRFLGCFPRVSVQHHLDVGSLRALEGFTRLPRFELQALTRRGIAPKRSASALIVELKEILNQSRRATGRRRRSP